MTKRTAKPAAAPKLAPKAKPKPPIQAAPEPKQSMNAEQCRNAKRRVGGCFMIANQRRRIERKKAGRGKAVIPGNPSAMTVIQKIAAPVVSIAIGLAQILAAFVGAGARAAASYVPEIERKAERDRQTAYQRRNAGGGTVPSPKAFATAYAAKSGGEGSGGGGAHLKALPGLATPQPDPSPDEHWSRENVQRRSERDYGDRRFVEHVAAFFKQARHDPEGAAAKLDPAMIGSYSEELLAFMRHPLRSDMKNLDARIHAIAEKSKVSREAATEIAMDTILETVQQRKYDAEQRAARLAAIEAEENPSPPSHKQSGTTARAS